MYIFEVEQNVIYGAYCDIHSKCGASGINTRATLKWQVVEDNGSGTVYIHFSLLSVHHFTD
jgi:hypothetical protein